jgi:putative flippase GtrA
MPAPPAAPQRQSASLTPRLPIAPVLVQFAKFGIVGVANTLLTFAVFTVLVKGFGVWYLAASAIGFLVGTVNSFLLNRRWTFRGHVGDALTPVRWFVVQGCGLALNLALIYLLVDGAGLDKLLGQAFAIGVVTVLTFLANRAWTFRMDAPATLGPPPSAAASQIGGEG